jgi:hypothetical protein
MERNQDLGRINRSHTELEENTFYDASAEFPADMSEFLMPNEDRWWDTLGEPYMLIFLYRNAYIP